MSDADDSPASRGPATLVAVATRREAQPGTTGHQAATTTTTLTTTTPGSAPPAPPPVTSFDRRELNSILRVYGRKVAEGEWRDYAIDFRRDEAVFSIFRRASEMPLFRIVKDMRLARRQGAYSVVAAGGMILKRGPDLDRVLAVLDRRRTLRLVEA